MLISTVLNVEEYPKFIPWCSAVKVLSHKNNIIIADTVIKFKTFIAKYQSSIVYSQNNDVHIVSIKSTSGPFKNLNSNWLFYASNNYTVIEFEIEFELKSILFNKMVKLVINQVATKVLEAFENRVKSTMDNC